MLHSGYEPDALDLAKRMIEVFEDADYVAVNAAGCGSVMRDYGHVLSDDVEWEEPARRFSEKVRDVSQLLAMPDPPVAFRHPVRQPGPCPEGQVGPAPAPDRRSRA